MSEDLIQVFGNAEAAAGVPRAEVAAAPPAAQRRSLRPRPSLLGRQLSSPKLRLLDKAAIQLALALTLLDSPMLRGQSLADYLVARISIRTLMAGTALLALWRVLEWTLGLYQSNLNYRAAVLIWKVPVATLLCAMPIPYLLRFADPASGSPRDALLFWFYACTLLLVIRAGVVTIEEHIRPAFRKPRTAVICGTGPLARTKALELAAHRKFRYQLLGFVDNNPHPEAHALAPLLCGVGELERMLMHQPIDEVIIGLPLKSRFGEVEEIVAICGRAGVQMQYSLDLFDTDVVKSRKVGEGESEGVVLEMVHHDHRILMKDVFDRTLSAIGLVLLSPLFAAIAIAIKLSSPGPVFFVQQRFGLNKRRFGMIKFRSMVVDAEARQATLEHMNENKGPTFKMRNDPRVTRVGALLRSTSLDELPQLLNVLRGEMSLVGPRPLPTRDVQRFSEPWLMRRFSVKPGITGLWQVSGRSDTDFDAAIKLDLHYIDRWSLVMDVRILVRTFGAVIRRSGAY